MRDRRSFLTLAAEIRQELASLSRTGHEIEATWARRVSAAPGDRRTYVESTALKLHNFYTACERIFEKVATDVDGGMRQAHDWHLRLLRAMSVDVPEVRPRALSADLAERLADYLRFRHLVRNLYGFELEEAKMHPLVQEIGTVRCDIEREIGDFCTFLEALGREPPD